jgi:hypothetical protein
MPAGPRSSFKRSAAAAALALISVAGCTNAGLLTATPLKLETIDTAPQTVVAPAALPLKGTDDKIVIKPAARMVDAPVSNPASAWCRYLQEDTAAQATILRSPTVSGSLDDSGKSRLSVSLSAGSFNKARLIEQASDIKCRKYLAETGLQKLVFLAPQGLTAAGFRAKADRIKRKQGELQALRKLVRKQLAAGLLDVEKATGLTVLIDQVIADGDAARSQADRRMGSGISNPQAARQLAADLLKAEQELEGLNSRLRTADAFDVSVSAGWNDSDISNGYSTSNDSFSGKVSFSVKLGALAPSRFEHERRATAAKLQALQSEEGGLLWQVDILRRAHQNAIEGLAGSRRKLDEAIAEATRLVSVLRSAESPEYEPALVAARIQLVRLQAERAGVDGSIAEIRANMQKLKLG